MSADSKDDKNINEVRHEISIIMQGGHRQYNIGELEKLLIIKSEKGLEITCKEQNEFIKKHFETIFNYRPSMHDNEYSSNNYRPSIDIGSKQFGELKELILSKDDIDYGPILLEIKEINQCFLEGLNPYGDTMPLVQDYIIGQLYPKLIEKLCSSNNIEWKKFIRSLLKSRALKEYLVFRGLLVDGMDIDEKN